MDHTEILRQFGVQGEVIENIPFGSGHINDTRRMLVREGAGTHSYILQRINTAIFPDPDVLMENIMRVTTYLSGIILARGGDPSRETLHFYQTLDGRNYFRTPQGECWRLEDTISGTLSYDQCPSAEMFESTGYAFGRFMADLSGFPAEELGEVIPNFHNTRARYETFLKDLSADRAGRRKDCEAEIAFIVAHKPLSEELLQRQEAGCLPLRVTHNDTKINNILMDEKTGQPICIVDLDTIMPGVCANDFGDSIRFGASSAAEDEKDLSKVYMRMDLFDAYAKGYLRATSGIITPDEADSLAVSALVITYENGIRFLDDFLNGDVYYKTDHPTHNLERARTQFKLVADMEGKLPRMKQIVAGYYEKDRL